MEINTRSQFGTLAQSFFKIGKGAEIGVERGNFSQLILSQWKGSLMSVDMWDHKEIYATAMKTLTDPRCILSKQALSMLQRMCLMVLLISFT